MHQMTRDGCTLDRAVLSEDPTVSLRDLRGITILPNGDLVVNSAYKDNSQILLYGECSLKYPERAFKRVIADRDDPYLVHPYGVAVARGGERVYISNQVGDRRDFFKPP